jgi:hypothetical protein
MILSQFRKNVYIDLEPIIIMSYVLYLKGEIAHIIKNLDSNHINRIELFPHGIRILNRSGVNIYDHYFSDKLDSDASLIAGLISAISAFTDEIIKGNGFLKNIHT